MRIGRDILNRKTKGHWSTGIAFIITTFFMFVFFIAMIEYVYPIKTYIDIRQFARKYTYMMEKDGYLSPSNLSKLQNELTTYGLSMSKVTITATTAKVEFGQEVFIQIDYNFTKKEKTINGFNVQSTDKVYPLKIRLSTTSKNGS